MLLVELEEEAWCASFHRRAVAEDDERGTKFDMYNDMGWFQ